MRLIKLLNNGQLVEVENNEAHRLIDGGKAMLASDNEIQGYRNKMLRPQPKHGEYKTK